METADRLPEVRNRPIKGISAILVTFDRNGQPNLDELCQNLVRTTSSGLTPAVNMDTGYVNLLSSSQRRLVLDAAHSTGHPFVAGAFIQEMEGDPLAIYLNVASNIVEQGGIPVIFPSGWLKSLSEPRAVGVFQQIAKHIPEFIGFELGEMFVPYGRIFTLAAYRELLDIPQMTGLKHSSLSRQAEWDRLSIRNEVRADFHLYTGNDLAIDMVMWGSDYLLGLSAFHPEAFALRDCWWASGDSRFFELNDALQYLGAFAFRPPVPAYKHSCAQFLKLRGRIASDEPHPSGIRRPETDSEVLAHALERIESARNLLLT
ncbi:MAG: hypothetical protein P4L46_25760 [Fimbriimonas sp.]|nr:hypothetical protein [Fimbriimonas sp.]